MDGLARLMDLTETGLLGAIFVFARVSAIVSVLPAFGDRMIPVRLRLGLAIAFTLIVWPLLAPGLATPPPTRAFAPTLLVEIGIGLMLGLAIRLMAIALQFAGSVASQSTALAQIFGAGIAPDPMPAMGNILMLAGVTLAITLGLHVKVTVAMAHSYEILPMGLPVPASDVVTWGTARVAQAFALGFSLAAPFVIAAFAYNIALGAINRAMPQLMVAFIGAPAIAAGGLMILMLAAPLILSFWSGRLDLVLADPFGMPR